MPDAVAGSGGASVFTVKVNESPFPTMGTRAAVPTL